MFRRNRRKNKTSKEERPRRIGRSKSFVLRRPKENIDILIKGNEKGRVKKLKGRKRSISDFFHRSKKAPSKTEEKDPHTVINSEALKGSLAVAKKVSEAIDREKTSRKIAEVPEVRKQEKTSQQKPKQQKAKQKTENLRYTQFKEPMEKEAAGQHTRQQEETNSYLQETDDAALEDEHTLDSQDSLLADEYESGDDNSHEGTNFTFGW